MRFFTQRRRALISSQQKEYEFLEYVYRTSTMYYTTGWTYTGIIPDNNTKVEYEYRLKTDLGAAAPYENIFGTANFGLVNNNNSFKYIANFGNQSINTDFAPQVRQKTKITFSKNGYFVNDVLIQEFIDNDFTSTTQLALFANTRFGRIYDIYNRGDCWMYSCKIWQSDILVRDFRPCRKKATGEVGFLEMVENKFYGNDNNGANATRVEYEGGPVL